MADWLERPIHQALYAMERTAASIGWGIDRSGLYLVDLLERLRTAIITGGFVPAIDTVATSVLGISRPMFELSFTLGMLTLIMVPLVTMRFFNVRNALVLALLLPIVLPVAGSTFQGLEQIRSDLGNSFYETIFNQTSFDLLPPGEEHSGRSATMAALAPYVPGAACCRGIDVAAAYLYATRQDVLDPGNPPPSDLPDEFERQFFAPSMEQFGELEPWQRWEQIRRSSEGITRTFYGVILVLFAFLESLTHLSFTLALGFLLIALIISLIFVFFAPCENVTYALGKKGMELMVASWGISVLQGLLLAAVVDVANGANAFATLGIGILALVLQTVFLSIGLKAIIGAILGAASAATGGTVSGRDLGALTGTVGGALAGGYAQAMLAGAEAQSAYVTARRAGASPGYATGFALSQIRPLRRVGALAAAMGSALPGAVQQGFSAERRAAQERIVRFGLAGQQRANAAEPSSFTDDDVKGRTGKTTAAYREALYRATPERAPHTPLSQRALPGTSAGVESTRLAPEQIAEAIAAEATSGSDLDMQDGAELVAQRLNLDPGAFGARSERVSRLVAGLRATGLAQEALRPMLQSAYTSGRLTPEQREQLIDALMRQGMSYTDASEQARVLTSLMAVMPGSAQRMPDPRAPILQRIRAAELPPGLALQLASELTSAGTTSPELAARAVTALKARRGLSAAQAHAAFAQLITEARSAGMGTPQVPSTTIEPQGLNGSALPTSQTETSPTAGAVIHADDATPGAPAEGHAAHIPAGSGSRGQRTQQRAMGESLTREERQKYFRLMGAARNAERRGNHGQAVALRAQARLIRRGKRGQPERDAARRQQASSTEEQ